MVDVLIIGGGSSGLYAAKLLNSIKGLNVLVVEASDIIGGRVRQNTDFTYWRIDIGGELVHGGNTLLKKMCDLNGWKLIPVFTSFPSEHNQSSEYIYLGRERKLVPFNSTDPDIAHLLNVIRNLGSDMDFEKEKDMSMLSYLAKRGVAFRVMGVADVIYAKTYGTNLDRLSVKDCAREDQKLVTLDKGDDNYKVEGSFSQLLEYISKGVNVKLNWQAKKVGYSTSDNLVKVTNQRGEEITAKRVIVTVPLTVFKSGDITYSPPLPSPYLEAANTLGMDGGMKVILKFHRKFWPSGISLVFCADSFVPQLWFDGPPGRPLPEGVTPVWTCVGFVTGDQAKLMSNMNKDKIVDTFLRLLDDIFSTSDPAPASSAYLDALIFDWGKQPFVRGSYSYPAVGADFPQKTMIKPVNNFLFFAGEGKATENEPTPINGGLKTGKRAATEVAKSLGLSLNTEPP
eukprot:TRINITY_DN5798_c0_g1_i1.p1 TRINITY_DN5798_c0_g1~~TRINITY_DN5798_c0_g1_i1.p1  ORF type:complete len:456 (+),score=88.22 TRINITY_DN5798_c0_g1_i1:623-1990(+)